MTEEAPVSVNSGMDPTVKKLDDNVFTLFGGRSPTPSVDGDDKQDQYQCKGGPGKLNCGMIVDPSKNGEAGIKCDMCSNWYHATCQLVPKAAVTAVGKFTMIHWFCSVCRVSLFGKSDVSLKKMEHRLDTLENESIKEMSERVESMEKVVKDHVKLVNSVLRNQEETANRQEKLMERTFKELHEQKTSYADIVKGSCDKVAKDMTVQIADMKKVNGQAVTPTNDIYTTIGSVMDKERRKLNLVIHNLPESKPTELDSREKLDLQKFERFSKDALNLSPRAQKCFRAGRVQEGRPRLLVVTLTDLETKMELLRLSSQLRSMPEWRHVYINPDLTPAEREVNRTLRQELATRRSAGEVNLVIKQGKIVQSNLNNRRVTGLGGEEAPKVTPKVGPSSGGPTQAL